MTVNCLPSMKECDAPAAGRHDCFATPRSWRRRCLIRRRTRDGADRKAAGTSGRARGADASRALHMAPFPSRGGCGPVRDPSRGRSAHHRRDVDHVLLEAEARAVDAERAPDHLAHVQDGQALPGRVALGDVVLPRVEVDLAERAGGGDRLGAAVARVLRGSCASGRRRRPARRAPGWRRSSRSCSPTRPARSRAPRRRRPCASGTRGPRPA